MNVTERINFFRQIDLFHSFLPFELEEFAERVCETSLAVGDILFHEGDPGLEMYILLEGGLKVYKENRLICMIRPVGYVGEMAIIEAKPRSATVQAIEPCMLLKISAEQFQEYFARQPKSLVAMMKTLSQRIRHDNDQVAKEFEKANILIHDMKNLLSTFLFLELLKKKVPDEQLKYVKHMQAARDGLALMMDEAMANAKRQYRPLVLSKGSLCDLVLDLIDSELFIHPDLQDKHIGVRVDEPLPDMMFSPLDLRRVLTNLILNAAQASNSGDVVEILIGRNAKRVKVSIIDKGCGIPLHFRDKVFLSHFSTRPGGNGLGLASCRHIIEELYQGELSFQDNPAGGTIFSFTLPLEA